MWEVGVKYTELETQSLISDRREFSDLSDAKGWAGDIVENGLWHEHSEDKLEFIRPSNIHKVIVERG